MEQEVPKPKRGRPRAQPKVPVDGNEINGSTSVTAPKKRGRKSVYNNYEKISSVEQENFCSSEDEHIILKLSPPLIENTNDEILEPEPFDDMDAQFSSFNKFSTFTQSKEQERDCQGGLKVIDLLTDFEEKNKNNEWPQTTSIFCYWCCHKFDNAPFGIPVKHSCNKFHVYGCFCSLECATAYNFESKESHDEIWERYNLINLLAVKIGSGCDAVKAVKAAPSRLSLSIFGGHLSIEEFREYCKTSKLININFPPMMTLKQQLEEINECDISDCKYIPVDTDRINRYKDKLNLKRTKPINNIEKTLDSTMNLQFGADE